MKKKSLVGWIDRNWDLQAIDSYGKLSIMPVVLSKHYEGHYFSTRIRAEKYRNDNAEPVKVIITIEEL